MKVALTDTKRNLSDYHQKKMFIQGELAYKNDMMKVIKNLFKSFLKSFLQVTTSLASSMTV